MFKQVNEANEFNDLVEQFLTSRNLVKNQVKAQKLGDLAVIQETAKLKQNVLEEQQRIKKQRQEQIATDKVIAEVLDDDTKTKKDIKVEEVKLDLMDIFKTLKATGIFNRGSRTKFEVKGKTLNNERSKFGNGYISFNPENNTFTMVHETGIVTDYVYPTNRYTRKDSEDLLRLLFDSEFEAGEIISEHAVAIYKSMLDAVGMPDKPSDKDRRKYKLVHSLTEDEKTEVEELEGKSDEDESEGKTDEDESEAESGLPPLEIPSHESRSSVVRRKKRIPTPPTTAPPLDSAVSAVRKNKPRGRSRSRSAKPGDRSRSRSAKPRKPPVPPSEASTSEEITEEERLRRLALELEDELRDNSGLPESKGNGLFTGAAIIIPEDPLKCANRLSVLCGARQAGNDSPHLTKEMTALMDHLLRSKVITKANHKKLHKLYIK